MITEWLNCYPSNWKGVVVPEAMAHPAKYSSKLIRRIYEHMIEQGWVHEGDRVLDPFGGVALGALDAMRLGLDWTGIELEEKFFNLGNENISKWGTQYGSMPHWGTARLLHGDSRHLLSVIGASVQVSVSSPPYGDVAMQGGEDWLKKNGKGLTRGESFFLTYNKDNPANLGNMPANQFDAAISSPPYADSIEHKGGIDPAKSNHKGGPNSQMNNSDTRYGVSDGQLGGMKNTGFDAAISSPPFLQSEGGTPEPKEGGAIDKALYKRHAAGNAKANGYGKSDGQLSSMRDGGFQAALSSPPYAEARIGQESGQEHCGHHDQYGENTGQLGAMPADEFAAAVSSPPYEDTRIAGAGETVEMSMRRVKEPKYGETEGQLGGADDFWLAARAIVEQVHQALVPGGHAVWVTKRYVKGGKIVEFSDQWVQLCEAVGFKVVCWHHAMLVHKKGAQHTLEGGLIEKKTSSKSFFRRLAESKGSPEINWEDVICMEKTP